MPRRRRRAVLGLVVLLIAAAAVVGVTIRPGTPVGERLAESLERAGDGFNVLGPCESQGGRVWTCFIEDDPGSGESDAYRLQLDSDECWSGARTENPPGGQPLSDCL
jgi:hypothetical protein